VKPDDEPDTVLMNSIKRARASIEESKSKGVGER